MKIYESEKLKRGYGFAWRNYVDNSCTAYPVPFNFIARWSREVWFYLSGYRKTYTDIVYHDGYNAGRKSADNEWSSVVGKVILAERERLTPQE